MFDAGDSVKTDFFLSKEVLKNVTGNSAWRALNQSGFVWGFFPFSFSFPCKYPVSDFLLFQWCLPHRWQFPGLRWMPGAAWCCGSRPVHAGPWSWVSCVVPASPSRSMLVGVCYSSKSFSQLVSNRDNVAPQDGFEGRFEVAVFPCKLQAPGPAVGSVPSRVCSSLCPSALQSTAGAQGPALALRGRLGCGAGTGHLAGTCVSLG